MLVRGFCIGRNGETGGGGRGHLQGVMHMVAARLGFEKAMVRTGWATFCHDCKDRLRKHYSHLVEGWFLGRKAAWALSRFMTTNSAEYCMLVNEWAWAKLRVCLLKLEMDAGSVLESELRQKRKCGELKAYIC